MKKKLRKQLHKQFLWYDYSFLLKMMEMWCKNASKQHKERGWLLRSDSTSKKLKLVSEVLRRIINDDYDNPCVVFPSRNKVVKKESSLFGMKEDLVYLDLKYQNKQRQADIDFVFGYIAKYLLEFWD